jgi:hypothetical protein
MDDSSVVARRSECANCGRDVRDLPDSERRYEGGRWFCSQSCFLSYESSAARSTARKATKTHGKWRRRIGWTIGVIVGLCVILAVIGAVTNTSSSPKASGKTDSTKHHRLGTRLRPIPVGTAFTVPEPVEPWRVRVTHVYLNADKVVTHLPAPITLYLPGGVHRYENSPPARGSQYVLVALTLKYLGPSPTDPRDLTDYLYVIGKHEVPYLNTHCKAPNDLGDERWVHPGQSTSGDLCYEVASNDASTLRMYSDASLYNGMPRTKSVWFALR